MYIYNTFLDCAKGMFVCTKCVFKLSNLSNSSKLVVYLCSSTKLAVLSNSLPQKKALALPSLTSQPHQVLASDLVPYSDVQQVTIHKHAHTRHFGVLFPLKHYSWHSSCLLHSTSARCSWKQWPSFIKRPYGRKTCI